MEKVKQMEKKYLLGLDYGTLSARALLLNAENGEEVASAVAEYPHGILTDPARPEAAYQHPADYEEALRHLVGEVLKGAGIRPDEIAGIGLDFTASTVLPVDGEGRPLCYREEFREDKEALVKLWKHHGATWEADRITEVAEKEGEEWLAVFGGRVSCEWMLPKLYEVLRRSPSVFAATERYLEAGDYLVWQMTGVESHNTCMAGYKGLWRKGHGFPKNEFWAKVDPLLDGVIGTKVSSEVIPSGSLAGTVSAEGARKYGLAEGTPVASPVIDAHAALPSAGIVEAGRMGLILGTSACHIVLCGETHPVPGICGYVEDGIVPGLTSYEAGQSSMGDTYAWFVENMVPAAYTKEAEERGESVFALLDRKASALRVGESGVLALDFFNGNRTPYADYSLKGMLLGMTLTTRPEEIYRALIEATAFGTRRILELYREHGIGIGEILASGGIAKKNPFLMQIYADVCGVPIRVMESSQAAARGACVLAALGAGCFPCAASAAAVLGDKAHATYTPIPENTRAYEGLYREYVTLGEYFAKENGVMRRLG